MAAALDDAGSTSSFRNASFQYLPSATDLLYAVPRLARRASSFALFYLPDQLDGLFSIARNSGSIIADATSHSFAATNISTITAATVAATQSPLATSTQVPSTSDHGFFSTLMDGFSVQKLSNLDSVFSYLASRWAISTFVVAILLNRAHVYASSRRHLRLNWYSRLFLRIVPIALFLYRIPTILQLMRCQTGNFMLQRGISDVEKILNGAFTHEGGPLHRLSSSLLFWQSEEQSCLAAGMIPPNGQRSPVYGSSSVLWPLFMSLCISHLVETISCALQGRQPMAETGMTIFEHSLAFAEAEAVVRSSVGLGLFGLPLTPETPTSTLSSLATASPTTSASVGAGAVKQLVTRSMIMQRLNVPPEVLLIALISSLSHLSSHCLGVLGLQSRFRLINTGIWGICFMVAFGWSFFKFSQTTNHGDLGVLRYPTVCIIGFIPHLMIIVGSLVCMVIYAFALLLTVLSPPTTGQVHGSFRERLIMAHRNLQANAFLSTIHISMQDEFYTTILKAGFSVLTAASEAVYFNEGSIVTLGQRTWLEDKRMGEMEKARKVAGKLRASIPPEIQGGVVANGLSLVDVDSFPPSVGVPIVSGYARERKTTTPTGTVGAAAMKEEGTGGSQRSGRWILSWILVRQVWHLFVCCWAILSLSFLQLIGINRGPTWLRQLATLPAAREETTLGSDRPPETKALEFWMLSEDGIMHLPTDDSVDVEYETRKRLLHSDSPQDGNIDAHLYGWWKSGGWWGEVDSSGEYQPKNVEDDETSIISTTDAESSAWESDTDDGRRTPTQARFDRGRQASQAVEDTFEHIAKLLDPRTLEEKQEARLLAQRLQTTGPMTRAQYKRTLEREKLRLLAPRHSMLASESRSGALVNVDPEVLRQEEEELLEQIILSRRSASLKSPSSGPKTWEEGAEGMGDSGPQCVVCHSNPRTILVWPCRCLSLCEECRVSLAMNNFGSCVCCRRDVVAFSRLYVP